MEECREGTGCPLRRTAYLGGRSCAQQLARRTAQSPQSHSSCSRPRPHCPPHSLLAMALVSSWLRAGAAARRPLQLPRPALAALHIPKLTPEQLAAEAAAMDAELGEMFGDVAEARGSREPAGAPSQAHTARSETPTAAFVDATLGQRAETPAHGEGAAGGRGAGAEIDGTAGAASNPAPVINITYHIHHHYYGKQGNGREEPR